MYVVFFLMIRRPPRSTLSSSSAASDVYKRQVLIFERIKEELKATKNIQKAISAGYEKALLTIADANITTLIASIVLFSFGTGAIKGFAVTLSIGIITSMFTAIIVSRAVINIIYGGKKIEELAI